MNQYNANISEWSNLYEIQRVYNQISPAFTNVAFDNSQELIWATDSTGYVTTFTPDLNRYSSVKVSNEFCSTILPTQEYVYILCDEGIKAYTRGCCLHHTFGSDIPDINKYRLADISRSKLLDRPNFIYIGSPEINKICSINTMTGQHSFHDLTHNITSLNYNSRFITCGSSTGQVSLLDHRMSSIVKSFQAHPGMIMSLETQNNILTTSGLTSSDYTKYAADRTLKFYDTRTFGLIEFISLPDSSHSMLKPTNSMIIPSIISLSKYGKGQVISVQGAITPVSFFNIYLNNANPIPTISSNIVIQDFDISISGEALVYIDSIGGLSLNTNQMNGMFRINHQSIPLEMPSIPPKGPPISISPMDPNPFSYIVDLGSIPQNQNNQMRSPSLSDYFYSEYPPLPPLSAMSFRIKNELMKKAIVKENHPTYIPIDDKKFEPNTIIFGKNRDAILENCDARYNHHNNEDNSDDNDRNSGVNIDPYEYIDPLYREVNLRYGKLGLDDFDFSIYNRTHFAGLENTYSYGYINSLIYFLYTIPEVHLLVFRHICNETNCVICELFFLFKMMDQCQNDEERSTRSVQPMNFVRCLQGLKQLKLLHVFDPTVQTYPQVVSSVLKFLLNQLNNFKINEEMNTLNSLFGISITETLICKIHEKDDISKTDVTTLNLDFEIPLKTVDNSFISLLNYNFNKSHMLPAWCNLCQTYSKHAKEKTVMNVSSLLCIAITDENNKTPWKSNDWIVPKLILSHNKDTNQIAAKSPSSSDYVPIEGEELEYNLTHIIYLIQEGNKNTHCITISYTIDNYGNNENTIVNVPLDDPLGKWYLFNDFSIQEVLKHTAYSMHCDYMTPCVMLYRLNTDNIKTNPIIISSLTTSSTTTIADSSTTTTTTTSTSVITNTSDKSNHNKLSVDLPSPMQYSPIKQLAFEQPSLTTRSLPPMLTLPNVPVKGDYISIDCEFVALSGEEATIANDGSRVVKKEMQLSLARVSVVDYKGDCIIDDYIIQQQPVVDYLTRFSGLTADDLDPHLSKHYLVTLKTEYLKLRHLVDSGCIFIGHGYFRIINIYVPHNQVKDTVKLFYLPNQRKLSLKFLACHLLDWDIQADNHDSIEDAKTALFLYKKYEECVSNGTINAVIEKLYETGRISNWN